jgi:hypothetical protein
VEADETVRCVWVDRDRRGQVIVEKQAPGDQNPFFEPGATFSSDLPCFGLLTLFSGQEGACGSLVPGTYTVSEEEVLGAAAEFVSLSCDDDNSTVDPATRTATIRVEADETVRCVFVNRTPREDTAARNVTLTDELPAGADVSWSMDPTVPECSLDGRLLSCTFAELADEETVSVHVTSPTTTGSCGRYDNTAIARAENRDEVSASASITVVCPGTISISDVSVTEGDTGTTDAVFSVALSAASAQEVTVDFATADDTATAPADYVAATGTLTFAPGETEKTVTIAVNGDTLVESDETFFVNLSNATGGATIADGQGVGTIIDDDLPTLDNFKCYKAKQLGTRFDPRRVILTDQFNTERVNVVRPEAFCTPVDKNGEGINDPTAHLTCYKARDVRGDEFPAFRRQPVEAGDQFGTHTLLLKAVRSLCLRSSKSPAGQVPGPPTESLDHFKCYTTKQLGTKFDPRQVLLTDQFITERVNVVRPEAFCTPVDKNGEGINDPNAHLTCYKIRDIRRDEFPAFERRRVEAGDQFGTHSLLVTKTRTLCLPSSKTVL